MKGKKNYYASLSLILAKTFIFLITCYLAIPGAMAGDITPVAKRIVLADRATYNSVDFLSLGLHDTIMLQTPDKKIFIATVNKINRSKPHQVTALLGIHGYPEGFLSLTTCGNSLCGIFTIGQLQPDYQVMANGDGEIIRFTEPDYFGKIRNHSNSIPTF